MAVDSKSSPEIHQRHDDGRDGAEEECSVITVSSSQAAAPDQAR